MANVEKTAHADSEMEEGEIVDELDDLSDISSEEEFLLRQRLEVLEDYNNALERTKKKRSSGWTPVKGRKPMRDLLCDLSEISAAEADDIKQNSQNEDIKHIKTQKHYSKTKKRKEHVYKSIEEVYVKRKKDHKKKSNYTKRKPSFKAISESSDESEDEYRNKRKKLADAVVGHRGKTDTSSLSARLQKMMHKSDNLPLEMDVLNKCQNNNNQIKKIQLDYTPLILESVDEVDCVEPKLTPKETVKETKKLSEPIDLLTSDDDDVKVIPNENIQPNILENNTSETKSQEADTDSDEDLAQLRQQVLSTKHLKAKTPEAEPENKIPSEDEDSDTTELRLICLKSTILKRAIEMKQKQKLQKRLSQTTLEDDIFNDSIFLSSKIDSDNNTDIESMDMDIGSDADEKSKEGKDECVRLKKNEADNRLNDNHTSAITSLARKEEEEDDDEDLLRAKLLTSLSKNLPNLVDTEFLNNLDEIKISKSSTNKAEAVKVPEEQRFIIKLGESDSEGEHEATKNLTKMHMKLSEQTEFQQKLDLFLKSTRMQVESNKLPDVVQKQATPKPEKYVAKAVNNLPKSEQLEYKNLVRRMAELEKMKQLRQASINLAKMSTDPSLEEKISISRKKIADESAKMLKLKDEATKLSQRFKIVTTELHNISTAITLNKKQQRSVQNCLARIRQQHQTLIKSSSTSLHSKVNGNYHNFTKAPIIISQKENNPTEKPLAPKTMKIRIRNDLLKDTHATPSTLSVEVNVASNTKVVTIPSPVKSPEKRVVEISKTPEKEMKERLQDLNTLANESCENTAPNVKSLSANMDEMKRVIGNQIYTADDYKSPLDAFGDTSWESDPNAILCPFEVGGQCKDPDCKYLHTKVSEQ